MKILTKPRILWMAALIAGSPVAFAQTSGTTGTSTMPAMAASQPATAVGVTPQAAAEANRKAVPRSDTATVVRTAPNAVDGTRNATGMNSATGTSGTAVTTGTAATSGTTSMNSASGSMDGTTTGKPMRKARADRN